MRTTNATPDILSRLLHLLLQSSPPDLIPPLPEMLSLFADYVTARTPVHCEAHGLWGSLPRLLAAILAAGNPQSEIPPRAVLLITAHIPDADKAQDDLETFLTQPVQLFPAAEAHETDPDPTSEIICERLRLCQLLTNHTSEHPILVAPIQALMQPVPSQPFLQQQTITLTVNRPFALADANPTSVESLTGPQAATHWLIDHAFTRVEQVDAVGEFAVRGGIIDIFAPGQDHPLRVEFFGDDIESLRFFDLDTQRSTCSIDDVSVTGCSTAATPDENTTFFDYLPAGALLVMEESTEIAEIGRIFLERLPDSSQVYSVEKILKQAMSFDILYANRFPAAACANTVAFAAQSVQRFENSGPEGLAQLVEMAQDQHVWLLCESSAEQQRITEIITTQLPNPGPPPPRLSLPNGFIHSGFALPDSQLILIGHHEVFGQYQQRRRIRRVKTIHAIESFTDLENGDLVVHVNHGIGRFRGLKALTKNGRKEEFLAVEYAGKALLHVPTSNIHLIHKYVGSTKERPRLSKLGANTWEKQKKKVGQAIEGMALGLVEMQAQRETAPGIAYPLDTDWQREFEESFPYQETDDQVTISCEIKQDMQKERPMDRLLCGDVGYGKTELALRAAFKAVEHGKQVAVLVPTTVLAEQHYRTFSERVADFPFHVEVLSRFRTARQASEIVARAARGQVDILIGTHRILSKDVAFGDLGLVIIDEEQRFGVTHKERLKTMRATVDVLTMTATPIPRTLHLSLLGIRDISSLTTPPLDRRSIVTEVCAYDEHRIRQAIMREIAREGQTYFLHNRVKTILATADKLRRLIPEARIIVAHGQMPKRQLEDRMVEFVQRGADVLVCTTIIESGLDIPNANTIIIDNANRFGLAELHQLRGRVGRYKNRAHAYMLLPRKRSINPTAMKRLKAIEEYSQLGAGFRIAMRDLEIRGAGNILGVEQSGHIDIVGYELYCRLLATAVRRLKGQPEPLAVITHLELDIQCNIPRSYIPADRQRMDVYRRIVTCASSADLEQLETDLADQFGKPPDLVCDMLQMAEIRVLASRCGIRNIVQKEPDLIFTLDKTTPDDRAPALPSGKNLVELLFDGSPGSVRVPDDHTIHLRLPKNYFDSSTTILALLRKLLNKPLSP